MTDNLRIWDAVSKTDPNHTKKVDFGRKFTSIDAHWQVMQATKQFGPIGEGWGYYVTHSIERLSDQMVLAVADVNIWWKNKDDNEPVDTFKDYPPREKTYGPIRATCEMWSPDRSGKMRVDEDAPKKAMTDALTKGLSHLGFSADVFLGLFDDNRYVQRVAKEFANGPVDIHGHPHKAAAMEAADFAKVSQRVGTSSEPRGLQHVDPADQHLVQGDGRSNYQLKTADKAPGRLAAELWASNAKTLFEQPGYTLLDYKEWKATPCTNKGTKTNDQKHAELREKHPDLADDLDTAISNIASVAA